MELVDTLDLGSSAKALRVRVSPGVQIFNSMRIIGKNEIIESQGMTVQDLLEFIEERNIPLTAKIMIQRVEDKYFEGVDISGMQTPEGGTYPPGSKAEGWGVYPKKGYAYYEAEELNIRMKEEIERRKNGEESEFPGIEDPEKYMQDLKDSKLLEQYHPAWSPVFYEDEQDLLFIDLHY